jgi:hypothetical protein
MFAELVPKPGATLLAREYRALVSAQERIAPPTSITIDVAAYDPRSVAHAASHWRKRMMDEYASTTVFSQLMAQLVEANASLDASAVTLRMAQDEFRHAETCGRMTEALGGKPSIVRDTTVHPIAIHPGCDARERALRNVIVATCLSEMYSIAFFVASLDRATDPCVRDVTRSLLGDEILHGRFGFVYLESCDWLQHEPDMRASISRYLRFGFATCEKEFVREPKDASGADDDALGIVPADHARDVFLETMSAAIVPGLERFGLDAERAWRTRSLTA